MHYLDTDIRLLEKFDLRGKSTMTTVDVNAIAHSAIPRLFV